MSEPRGEPDRDATSPFFGHGRRLSGHLTSTKWRISGCGMASTFRERNLRMTVQARRVELETLRTDLHSSGSFGPFRRKRQPARAQYVARTDFQRLPADGGPTLSAARSRPPWRRRIGRRMGRRAVLRHADPCRPQGGAGRRSGRHPVRPRHHHLQGFRARFLRARHQGGRAATYRRRRSRADGRPHQDRVLRQRRPDREQRHADGGSAGPAAGGARQPYEGAGAARLQHASGRGARAGAAADQLHRAGRACAAAVPSRARSPCQFRSGYASHPCARPYAADADGGVGPGGGRHRRVRRILRKQRQLLRHQLRFRADLRHLRRRGRSGRDRRCHLRRREARFVRNPVPEQRDRRLHLRAEQRCHQRAEDADHGQLHDHGLRRPGVGEPGLHSGHQRHGRRIGHIRTNGRIPRRGRGRCARRSLGERGIDRYRRRRSGQHIHDGEFAARERSRLRQLHHDCLRSRR
jgi:hypothetical protein